MDYRLVVQRHRRIWPSIGAEWEERWYILQCREGNTWKTIPTADFYSLPMAEQEEALSAHGFTKNPEGHWDPPKDWERQI